MAKPKLVLYVDVVSPFAYLAFHLVNTSPVFKECDVTYVPVFLGGIMKETGNTPPIAVKKKGEWSGKERLRWANSFGVPMAEGLPPGFPANTIKVRTRFKLLTVRLIFQQVQRVLTASAMLHPERLTDTLAAIYHASFAEQKEIHTPDSLMPILENIYGEKRAKEILTKSTSDEIKKLLTDNTKEAIAEGSFGLPWYAATNALGKKECFWGFDHIAQVADHLGLERPRPGSAGEGGWRAML